MKLFISNTKIPISLIFSENSEIDSFCDRRNLRLLNMLGCEEIHRVFITDTFDSISIDFTLKNKSEMKSIQFTLQSNFISYRDYEQEINSYKAELDKELIRSFGKSEDIEERDSEIRELESEISDLENEAREVNDNHFFQNDTKQECLVSCFNYLSDVTRMIDVWELQEYLDNNCTIVV